MQTPSPRTFGFPYRLSCNKFRNAALGRVVLACLFCGLYGSSVLYAQGPDRGREERGDRGDRGGGRGFDPSEMIRRMDADGNGVITAYEVERVPSFIRDRWQQQGLDFNRGVKVDQMVDTAQKQMEEMRRERENQEEERGRDRNRDRERSDRPEFQPPPEPSRETPRSSSSTPSKPRTRISPLLPESHRAIDTDYDGQIALYEWRMARKGTLSQFAASDLDNDGYLTAKELAKGPAAPAAASPTATTATAAVPTSPATAPTSVTVAPAEPVTVSVKAAAKASGQFDLLDTDKSGTISEKEWERSSRLRPLFEKAGVNLKEPLTKEQFTQWYVRAKADR